MAPKGPKPSLGQSESIKGKDEKQSSDFFMNHFLWASSNHLLASFTPNYIAFFA